MSEELFDVKQAARKLTGTPVEMAARIRQLILTKYPIHPEATAIEQATIHREEKKGAMDQFILRTRMALDFGDIHGWKLAKKPFTAAVLARGGVRDNSGACPYSCWPHEYTDHNYFYRSNNRAVSFVGHLYNNSPTNKDAARAWAKINGLSVAFPDDFPSWWYPNCTMLTVYTRATVGANQSETDLYRCQP